MPKGGNMIDLQSKREHVVLRTNGGFTAATLAEASTVRATEARASVRERRSLTGRAVRTLGKPLVDHALMGQETLLLTKGEALALAHRLSRAQTRNRSGGIGRSPRRR